MKAHAREVSEWEIERNFSSILILFDFRVSGFFHSRFVCYVSQSRVRYRDRACAGTLVEVVLVL